MNGSRLASNAVDCTILSYLIDAPLYAPSFVI
ncbi:hypothetical protein GGD41_002368 [Paraburkholderia bryophila]|uniref:Uncharacterized protein n=1 Tax=Paraburkholderia bryophila TaxID=420952 RepID=A0A7Z0B032_9BURK|nr:hypothetical protein [Paraburkholderia bryophila]